MSLSERTVDAFVYDGPLPPGENINSVTVSRGGILVECSIEDSISELADGPVYRTLSPAEREEICDWLESQQALSALTGAEEQNLPDPKWWTFESLELISYKNRTFITDGTATRDSNTDFYKIGKEIVTQAGSGQYITGEDHRQQITENPDEFFGNSGYGKFFRPVNGFAPYIVEPAIWNELLENREVDIVRPIIDVRTGLGTYTRDRGLNLTIPNGM